VYVHAKLIASLCTCVHTDIACVCVCTDVCVCVCVLDIVSCHMYYVCET